MLRSTVSLGLNAQGAVWILVSVVGATLMTVGVREVSAELHTVMLAFLRSALAALAVLPLVLRRGSRKGALAFGAWQLHLARGVAMVVALNGGFYAIWKLPLATASILFFLAPVFVTLLAALVMGERVGPRRWGAVLAGFLGAAIILRPGAAEFDPAMLAALASSAAFAVALILGRMASDRDGTDAVFVSSSLVIAVGTLPPALLFWEIPGSGWIWAVIGVVVAGSALRTYADIRAYAIGDAGFLAPFTYLRLLTVGLAGYLLFGETIDWGTAIGGCVIIAATLYIAVRESRIRREARRMEAP